MTPVNFTVQKPQAPFVQIQLNNSVLSQFNNDWTTALNHVINVASPSRTRVQVVLAPQVYILGNTSKQGSDFDQTIVFANLEDFIFDGSGSSLLFNQSGHYFQVVNCTRCMFQGFEFGVNWNALPLSGFACISALNRTSKTVELSFQESLDPFLRLPEFGPDLLLESDYDTGDIIFRSGVGFVSAENFKVLSMRQHIMCIEVTTMTLETESLLQNGTTDTWLSVWMHNGSQSAAWVVGEPYSTIEQFNPTQPAYYNRDITFVDLTTHGLAGSGFDIGLFTHYIQYENVNLVRDLSVPNGIRRKVGRRELVWRRRVRLY
eukprot:m.35328 g.35328  ORF g.35328 m.35328 type:complete len:318 (+) comp15699_c0_seq1:277-1230(+)